MSRHGADASPDAVGDVTAVILAGGAGTRLRTVVSDRQKVIAEVNGRPFLAYLLDQLAAAGIGRTVLCTGHLAEQVQAALGERWGGMAVEYSRESSPLGTGGALRLAASRVTTRDVLALNGDSYCDVDLSDVLADYRSHARHPLLVLSHQDDTSRFGRVDIGPDDSITAFREKEEGGGPGWINAGVYVVTRERLLAIPSDRPVSLERELFPAWLGTLRGHTCRGVFLDIGTPEAYGRAAGFFASLPVPKG